MLSLSLNKKQEFVHQNGALIWKWLTENKRYFFKIYNDKGRVEEAMSRTWQWAVMHMKMDEQEGIGETQESYLRAIGRTILHDSYTKHESPFSVYDDETGEVSYTYQRIVSAPEGEYFSEDVEDSLILEYTALYLRDSEAFRGVYVALREGKKNVIKSSDDKWVRDFKSLFREYSISQMVGAMREFFARLDKAEKRKRVGVKQKDLMIQPYTDECKMHLLGADVRQGKKCSRLSALTFTMSPPITDGKRFTVDVQHKGMVQINIDAYLDALYENIMVDEGVQTPYIRWLFGKYIMYSPSGTKSMVCENRERFIERCRRELISNLAQEVSGIFAVTSSYIYAIPQRKLMFSELHLRDFRNRVYILKVEERED